MNGDIQLKAEKLNKKHRMKRIWYRILTVPVCIVVFITTYALILPAITLESTPDTYCGLEEHTHTDECYETPSVEAHTEIKCDAAASLHTHTDECYGASGELICKQPDYIIHTHTELCFNSYGELICPLAENEEHIHSEECRDGTGRYICGKTNGTVHQHTAECVKSVEATPPQGLICKKTVHKHTESCFIRPKKGKAKAANRAAETRPEYADYITPSSAITSEATLTGPYANIYMTARSDSATSQLENEFSGIQTDDGKVLTDKSVVYGKDDYGAFDADSYKDYIFSVVMSALGQQYENTEEFVLRIPLDVVFAIDTSGSMVTDQNNNYAYLDRAENAIKTLNELAGFVMNINPDNRFGVATFSSNGSSWSSTTRYYNSFNSRELLPLNSYPAATESDILKFTKGTSGSNTNYWNSTVSVDTSVSGTASANATYFFGGTYTTAGYYQAYQMLNGTSVESRTVTKMGYELKRIPIVILITDGEVTICSNNSSNPYEYSSSFTTSGANAMDSNKAFNTILSAYHYKQLITEAYGSAKIYTVGIGTEAVSSKDLQAVLDPTDEKLNNMSSTYDTLKSNLKNGTNFPSGYRNLHGTEYYFCDGTYTTDTFNPYLTGTLESFIAENSGDFIYTSSQKNQTDVKMVDIIGSGMEIKGAPVLRYAGKNYNMTRVRISGNTQIYQYTGSEKVKANVFADEAALSLITARIDITDEGNQRITWEIPARLLPEYTHARTSGWYYEMLPARLIYQVGLTDESEQRVLAMNENSSQLIFYTNYFGGASDNAVAIITPAKTQSGVSSNPYYDKFTGETRYKTENTTSTRPAYREVTTLDEGEQITVIMGNNGKLEFATKRTDSASPKTALAVKKVWKDKYGTVITEGDKLPTYVTIVLKADGQPYDTCALNADNGWSHTFEQLPTTWESGKKIEWTADEETVPAAFEKESVVISGGSGWTTVTSLKDGGIYTFRGNNRYLYNTSGSTSAGGTTVNDENSQWIAISQADGTFKLQNSATGKYLGVYGTRGGWGGWGGNWSYSIVAGDGVNSSYGSSAYYYTWTLSSGRLYQSDSGRYLSISSNGSVSASTYGTYLTVSEQLPLTVTVTNTEKALMSLEIKKTVRASDTSGEFKFSVSREGAEPIIFTLKNGESYTVENIPAGAKVTVEELNPEGYHVSYIKNGKGEQSSLGSYTFTADSDIKLTVQNTASVNLPQTGGGGSKLFIIGGVALMLGAVMTGYFLRRRYGKEGD